MPIQLNPTHSAEQKLRTILDTAGQAGQGTVFVGDSAVSRRGAMSRLFKPNPTTHQASIENFKALLKQTYPGSAAKVDAALETTVARGRLTSGAVLRAYRQLHEDHKFKIDYPETATTTDEKLQFEDHRALSVLQNDKSRAVVCDFANRLADHIESSKAFGDDHAKEFLRDHLRRKANYPVHLGAENIPGTKAGIVEFLRNTAADASEDRHVLLLSMMWSLPNKVGQTEELPEAGLISRLYNSKVSEGKQHVDVRSRLIERSRKLDLYANTLADTLEARALPDLEASQLTGNSYQKTSQHMKRPQDLQLPATTADLIAFLRTPASADNTDHMLLKSSIILNAIDKGDASKQIESLQNRLIRNQRDGQFDRIMGAVTKPGTFGNTEIPSTLMDRFAPHQKEREAVVVNSHPNARVQKFLDEGKPYISGSSGMTNSGTTLFPLLGISMNSEEGRQYAEALGAFIVGSGEHSYPEVYKSLNLSLRYVQLAQPEPPDRARAKADAEEARRVALLTGNMLFGIAPSAAPARSS